MGFAWFLAGFFLGLFVYRWFGLQIEELLDMVFRGKE